MRKFAYLILSIILLISCQDSGPVESENPNIILITLDGVRWQEVFNGIDTNLLNNKKFTKNASMLENMFLSEDNDVRQEKLVPFLGTFISNNGILIGNRNEGSNIKLTNDQLFSYPGYNEILTGRADSSITSNDKIYNKNKTILELLNMDKNYSGKVAAFASWDVFPFIINDKRSGIPVSAGYSNLEDQKLSELESFIDKYQTMIPIFRYNVRFDLFTHILSMEHIKKRKPKVLFISYDQTDSFSHDGNYDDYILSLHNTDKMIQELWDYLQNNSYYKNNTYVFITTDHGRGDGDFPNSMWTSHGISVEGCEDIWLGILGPNLNKGIIEGDFYANQIAPSIAKITGINIGEEYIENAIEIHQD